jgi:hypothetical protein
MMLDIIHQGAINQIHNKLSLHPMGITKRWIITVSAKM